MYNKKTPKKTSIKVNESYKGETIEQKVHRIVNNKEPIKDGAPIIYTERKDGIKPAYDIRTDRWEIAAEAMDKVAESHFTKREGKVIKIDDQKPNQKPNQENPGTGANTSD